MRVFFITSESLKYHMDSHKGWNILWEIQNVNTKFGPLQTKTGGNLNNILEPLLE
jgi:hypothetical protein